MKLPVLGKLNPASLSLRATVGVWALVVVVFWWPCLAGPMAPLLGDAQANMLPWRAQSAPPPNPRWDALLWDGMAQYYPWRAFAARMARRGLIPLWNPHQFCGTPFVANGQSAFFYPPNWLFCVLEVRYAFGLTAALHYFLAGCFMLLLAHELGARPSAGLVGAAAYAFGGFMVCWTALPTLMNTAAWLPGVVWAIERAFRRRRPLDGLWVALMLGMTLLAGHLQIAVYVWLVAALHLAARLAWGAARRDVRGLAACLCAIPLAGLVASIQLLPTLELARLSPRGTARATEEGFRFRQDRALQPVMLQTLLLPDALGTPDDWVRGGLAYSETCGYVGCLSLGLALLALIGLRSRRALLLGALAALALLGAMGTVVSRLLYFHVPGLGQAGGFGRILCVYTFALAVLAALGADWLTSRLARARSVAWLPGLATWLPALAALVVCLEVGSWGRGFLPRSPRTRVYPATELTGRLVDLSRDGDRVLAVTRRDAWTIHRLPEALLPPNAATAYGYNDVQGYDSLYPAAYEALASWLSPDGHTPVTNGNMVLLDKPVPYGMWGAVVRWVVVPGHESMPEEQFVRRWAGEGVALYEDLHASPRVRFRDSRGDHPLTSPATGDPCRLSIEAAVSRSNHITVADTPYPGWHAYNDGDETPIQPERPSFRVVEVPFEVRRVEMVYRPASFAVGAFISLLGLSLGAAWIAGVGGRKGVAASVEDSRATD